LTCEEIKKIISYEPVPGSWFEKAIDIFLFSYFGNGINIKDILLLKYNNIDGDYIRFTRAKTQRCTRNNNRQITIVINEYVANILARQGNPNKSPFHFIFPVLEDGLSAEREMRLIQQFTKNVNKYLKKIIIDLHIQKPVTTYFARHSFATVLKKNGVSPLFISESLGHSSIKTTENYLDSFEDEHRKEIVKYLTLNR
jgi:integrase/recombinase XerD